MLHCRQGFYQNKWGVGYIFSVRSKILSTPGPFEILNKCVIISFVGAIRDQVTREDEIHNIQCIVDSLAKDFLHCDLSHITGVAIFEGDDTTIQYLMEIFIELESFLMEQISDEPSSQSEGEYSVVDIRA